MFLKYLKPLTHCSCVHFHSMLRFFPNNLYYILPASWTPTTIGHGNISKTRKSSSETDKDGIGTSTILVQDGLNFQELPVIVKKTNKIITQDLTKKEADEVSLPDNINLLVLSKLKEEIENCSSLSEVVDLLNEYPSVQYTPAFVTFLLTYTAEFQKDIEIHNEDNCTEVSHNFISLLDHDLIQKMCNVLCSSQETAMLLAGLQAVVHNNLILKNYSDFISQLFKELLLRLNEGKITIPQIYEFAALLLSFKGNHFSLLDQLWLGIVDKSNDIDNSNLLMMYRLLPLLKSSRKIVFRVLEKKTYSLWWHLSVEDVNEILDILVKLDLSYAKLLISLSKWINMNIHVVPEKRLGKMLDDFTQLNHIDSSIINAVERYVKVKNTNITDPVFVSYIMNFCLKFQLRSEIILENAATYFINHASDLSPAHISVIVKSFGMLNYLPQNSYEFYMKVEDVIQAKFIQFRPEDIIELFLSCTYIQRYPLNFVKRIFNRHFLDRLNTIQDKYELQATFNNLRLLDAAMTLECRHYHGPMISKENTPYRIYKDGRIIRMIKRVSGAFQEILGGIDYFAAERSLKKLPYSEMYAIDFVIHLNNEGIPIKMHERARIGKKIAVLIQLPQHYCFQSKCLVGHHAAKVRHLQRIGYTVVELDYNDLSLANKAELNTYLKSKIFPNV